MNWELPLASLIHVLAAVVWVGGMFFAYLILRPVAGQHLHAPQKLLLWRHVLPRFFVWVWAAVILLPVTGFWLGWGRFGEMGNWPIYVHVMHGLAWVMVALFLYVFFGPLRRLSKRVDEETWPAAGHVLPRIGRIVGINLTLGLIVVAVASGGRLFGW